MQNFLKRTHSDVYDLNTDAWVQEIALDPSYPTVFCMVVPCDADGNQVSGAFTGTVVYEIRTANNDEWVSIQADGDLAALQDSQFRAPATELRVTLDSPTGFTHFKIRASQHFL